MNLNFDCTTVFEELWDALQSGGYKYIRLIGGSGSSKTHSILQALYIYGQSVKNKRISAFRGTQTNCRKTVGEDAKKIYSGLPIQDFHKTTYTHWLKSGTFIEFTGTDDANILHGYETEISWFNEPYDIPKDVFTEIDKRATTCVIMDLNPKEDHWSDELEKRKDCKTIRCSFLNNPFLPERRRQTILGYKPIKYSNLVQKKLLKEIEAREYFTNTKKFSEEDFNDLVMCQLNEKQGSANEYQWKVYGLGHKADRPNRIFHWTPITYEQFRNIDATPIIGIDWGVSDPFAIVLLKYKDGCIYVHELNYASENEWMRELSLQGRTWNKEEEGGLADMILKNIRLPEPLDRKIKIICDSNYPEKVLSLRKCGWDNAISIGKKERVVQSVSTLSQLKVYYTSTSQNIFKEQELYERETDRYNVVLETPVDKDNHTIDAIRYDVTYLKRQGIIKIV